MMTNKIRRTEINIETHERIIIRLRGRRFSDYCERCQASVTAFTPAQTAAFFQMTLTDVCRFIGADKFHLVETKRGLPLVCGNSLGNENQALRLKTSANQS